MQKVDGALRLSASDLMRFMGCRHATALDLRYAEQKDLKPAEKSDEADLLQRQGDAHEQAFLTQLKSSGRRVVEIPKEGLPLERSIEQTVSAMKDGADVIFQGAFLDGTWGGYSDFLERVEQPSSLGSWSYEVVDTKLKRKPDPRHALQLSLYSDLLAKMQGKAPGRAHLELGDGSRFSLNLSDVSAYARHARSILQAFLAERPSTRPEPVTACSLCRWREHCQAEWEATDGLPLVAGITKIQRGKLEEVGVTTMRGLAEYEGRVPRMAPETQIKLQAQARLQTARRAGGGPTFELRRNEPGKGFGLLPKPDDGDIFYDIEGDPYVPGGGLEYLHGVWFRIEGAWQFKTFWAHSQEDEGKAAAELIEFFVDHMKRHPDAHIYHYANYEVAALRRLTARHRVGEAAVDQLQRERRFVDLFKVVSGALVASERGYSIKDLEAFYMGKRDGEVATAGTSVVFYERWRETHNDDLLRQIQDYNRTDCISTQLLRDWLVKSVRPPGAEWPILGAIPEAGALSNVKEEEAEIAGLRARLEPVRGRLGNEIAELLLDLSSFHEREDKPAYWAIFDRLATESEELLDDLECIQGLVAIAPAVKATARSFDREYSFPPQETKLRAGKKPCIKPASKPEDVDLRSIDFENNTLILRRSTAKGTLPDQLDLIPPQPFRNKVLREAVSATINNIIAGSASSRAIEHLLSRSLPTLSGAPRPNGIVDPGKDLVTEVSRAIADMDETTLAIQGPPGTGKTYVSAAGIVDLVNAGKRIAVSSNSHKAIDNLLEAIASRADEAGVACSLVKKSPDDEEEEAHPNIVTVTENDAPEISTADVVGATAWHFARYETPAFDYLVVDEAGQVSIANIVAMSRATRNIVLVGDPMQLPQPLQGSHPGNSGLSSLEYLIGDHQVIPPGRGIFMPVSRRMHPRVCSFISEAIYEGKLRSDEGAARQELMGRGGSSLAGAGVRATIHAGRSQVSPEEIEAIGAQITSLLGATYRDRDGRERLVTHDDILVVAPYNAQVNELRAALPDSVKIGTVDRFQGQEAPICLISMTTSSGDELPRDIEFLFSLNRINVAVSRAQALAMVFASPRLLEVPCNSIEQMALVNRLCLLHQYGGDRF